MRLWYFIAPAQSYLTANGPNRNILEDLRGFIAVDHTLEEIIVSFQGTIGWDWWDNIFHSSPKRWEAMRCPGECKVHSGWQDTEAKVNDEITKEIKRLLREYPEHGITVCFDHHQSYFVNGWKLRTSLPTRVISHLITLWFSSSAVQNYYVQLSLLTSLPAS